MSKIQISDLTMKVVTTDLTADPVEVRYNSDGVRLSVGENKIKFSGEDLDEVITVLERVRQEVDKNPPVPTDPDPVNPTSVPGIGAALDSAAG